MIVNAEVQNNNVEQGKEKKREQFKVNIDPESFDAMASTKYITSSYLCKKATELFKGIFADCEGTLFDMSGNMPTLSIIFNHREYASDDIVAITRNTSNNGNDGSYIQRIRNRDNYLANGDRYYATEDAKDVFTSLLSYQVFNNNKPNWGRVVVDFTENQQRFWQAQPVQYTKIGYIDLAKFAGMIWGNTDADGANVAYDVHIMRPLNNGVPGMPPSNYILGITRISERELNNTLEKLGVGSFSNIIR